MKDLLIRARSGQALSDKEILDLSETASTKELADVASHLRNQGFNNVVTYSKKVFIPLTHLCRDVCHYCTFATVPRLSLIHI